MCVCVRARVPLCSLTHISLCAGACIGHVSDLLELELEAGISSFIWVIGTNRVFQYLLLTLSHLFSGEFCFFNLLLALYYYFNGWVTGLIYNYSTYLPCKVKMIMGIFSFNFLSTQHTELTGTLQFGLEN